MAPEERWHTTIHWKTVGVVVTERVACTELGRCKQTVLQQHLTCEGQVQSNCIVVVGEHIIDV